MIIRLRSLAVAMVLAAALPHAVLAQTPRAQPSSRSQPSPAQIPAAQIPPAQIPAALAPAAQAATAAPVALPVAEPLAEEGWLGSVNRTLYAFNREVRGHVAAISERLPSLGTLNPKFRDGAGNLLNTWIAEPWQALSLAAAGRPADSWKVLDRVAVNITQGSGGLRDLATERGMPTAPYADIGLALCARGVPEGPYVVLPVVGGRTLRDGLSDIIVANALIYASLVPFTGPTPPLEVFIAVEILDNIPALLLAERIGRANNVDQARMNFEEARRAYLAARRTACDALRASP
ncbi:MAG: hypothetical protein EBY30_10720 [Rhodospirillales bacterium]|nr:hypothetical protein [Rhodospirillales bacterium]